jgi:hypothetical protein
MLTWLIRTFGRSFVWKLGAISALAFVGSLSKCYAQTIECSAACTVTVVHDLVLPPLQLDTEDGALIAGAVLAVWAVGWAGRMLIRTLSIDSKTTNESET